MKHGWLILRMPTSHRGVFLIWRVTSVQHLKALTCWPMRHIGSTILMHTFGTHVLHVLTSGKESLLMKSPSKLVQNITWPGKPVWDITWPGKPVWDIPWPGKPVWDIPWPGKPVRDIPWPGKPVCNITWPGMQVWDITALYAANEVGSNFVSFDFF